MTDAGAHRNAVEAWRRERYAVLRREIGWLTLAGLGWLRPGLNTLGADPDNDVVLPSGPSRAGTVTLEGGSAVADGDFSYDGGRVRNLELVSDKEEEATLLELGTLRLCLIERGGRLAVRTWNTESTARRDFAGIDHWPVDPDWRLDARFEPTPDAMLSVLDVLGTIEDEPSPGTVAFEIDGITHRLEGLKGGENGELWLVFGDPTNGVETYGGGRFLYTGAPAADGSIEVDFNRSYNPPCVFSPYATCPMPWAANRLPIRIEAGERMYRGHA